VTREVQALAIAQLLVAAFEGEKPGHRKLLRSRLRCSAEQQDEAIARELGVLELIDSARDKHLANLDADEGLTALCVPWHAIVTQAVGLLDQPKIECLRCGARLSRRRPICGRCRSPVPR
jgi:hypothetical protein